MEGEPGEHRRHQPSCGSATVLHLLSIERNICPAVSEGDDHGQRPEIDGPNIFRPVVPAVGDRRCGQLRRALLPRATSTQRTVGDTAERTLTLSKPGTDPVGDLSDH